MSPKLLVIDDDEAGCRLLQAIFGAEGFEVLIAHEGQLGLSRIEAERPDVAIVDLRLPGISGIEVLDQIRRQQPTLPVLILTAHGEIKSAVRATQLGAFDYLTKPIDHEEILLVVRRALQTRALQIEVEELRRQMGDGGALAIQMGPSSQIRRVSDEVNTVAGSNFSVLVLGETGTGKELVAHALHRQSERRGKPFIALDCGAIPETLLESELFGHEKGAFSGADKRKEGRFHLANGGTLFLDEIGNLPLALQAKLLRVLESKEVQPLGAAKTTPMDLRFVAATNADLQERAIQGLFRADLYFRLAQYTISLPPLRERPSDIAHLAQRFLAEASVELRHPVQQIPSEVLNILEKYSWPGNVRELRNVIRRSVLETKGLSLQRSLVQKILVSDGVQATAPKKVAAKSLKEGVDEAARTVERQMISDALRETQGNKSQAAKLLKTDYKTLHLKMKNLDLKARDFLR